MTVRVAVCYGQPTDPAAFDDYYERVHIPLANAIPGLTEYTYAKVSTLDAPSRRIIPWRACTSPTRTR